MTNLSNVDIFGGLFENRPSKILAIVFSFLSTSFAIFLFYGIVWFERFGTDNKRTLINKLVSSQCWSAIQYFAICQFIDILRYFVGPFPEWFCFFHLVLRNVIVIQIVLWMDVIAVVRYIFIFWLKNPLSFQDNFWSCFINRWMAISWFRLFCLFGILCLFS